ncbi:endothelin-converting enzyme homolog [Gigantopelta aegis]|uniref:endothelin-converting enzyme homolog n=1 Tax=Gigantopelta aegis TaxID=1735272 RepID=UPI001B887A18|nr:endothelin-converting enzyme homolog [Gigantopelta aegis]
MDNTRKKRATIIPGLTENEKQLFFTLHAQTMCEKTNERGIMKYYIKDEDQLSPPNKYRVNGVMMNFRPFTEAFRCRLHSSMNPETKCPIF